MIVNKEKLIERISKLDSIDLIGVEYAVRRAEPVGQKAWRDYLKIRKKLKQENNEEEKKILIKQAQTLSKTYQWGC